MRQMMLMVAALALAGCSITLPVRGSIADTGEKFSGSATGGMDSAGNLSIVSSQGARCAGAFVYINRRQGSGTFECSDGRTGPFDFVSTGRRGTGTGTLGGKRFTFTFGQF